MKQPTVCAVILASPGREAMGEKAIQCALAQSYPLVSVHIAHAVQGLSVGEMRNLANEEAKADIIAHFDDDDWSHPRRIEEQVALLQTTGADVAAYSRMLFWRDLQEIDLETGGETLKPGEAWLYTGEILGTSLCYWRRTWERARFRAKGWHNEDCGFVLDVRAAGGGVVAISSIDSEPRMIARIHGGYGGNAHNPSYRTLETHPQHWRRMPEWDDYCRERMEL